MLCGVLQTSDKRGAGTSANGVISIIGKLAEAGPVQLVNNGNSFQRGQLDELTQELPDVGHIQQVHCKCTLFLWLQCDTKQNTEQTGNVKAKFVMKCRGLM